MPTTQATRGHGVTFKFEADPVGAQGTFTILGELVNSGDWGFSREKTEVTPHNVGVRTYITSILGVDEIPVKVNFSPSNVDHKKIRDHELTDTEFGIQLIGRTGDVATDGIICSGRMLNVKFTNPPRSGERSMEGMFCPSGTFIVDGVVYS